MNEYTIIASPGNSFPRMLRTIRSGNYRIDSFKTIGLIIELSEKDLIVEVYSSEEIYAL
jgi:hypothetical protein